MGLGLLCYGGGCGFWVMGSVCCGGGGAVVGHGGNGRQCWVFLWVFFWRWLVIVMVVVVASIIGLFL